MPTVVSTPAPSAQASAEPVSPGYRASLRLYWRLMRRGTLLMWLTVATYMAVEVLVFRSAYPDAESRRKLLQLSTSTAVRMMQGEPGAIDTPGGFAAWDAGWMLMLITGSWALLTVTRLTRGEEDAGRAELVLCRVVTARQALAAQLSSMALAVAGIAVADALAFIVLGEQVGGALLWGAGLGAFSAVVAALGALIAQVLQPRRSAISAGFGLIAAAFLLRVVANSAQSRAWLLTCTPFGWADRLRVFSDNRWPWLVPPAVTALVLAGAALLLCERRDTGAALLHSDAIRPSSLRLLGSATAFGWRLTSGALLAWTLTLAATNLVFGLMTDAVVDFINTDDTYRRMLESMGMDMSVPIVGFLSYLAVFLALPLTAFMGWRIGAMRQEEADGRLDPVSVSQLAEPLAGTLPVIALFTGIAVLAFGIAPRLTVAAPVTLAVLSYLLDTFAAMLHWPHAVLTVSPFHHLARLPGTPMTTAAVLVMTAVGATAAAVGIVAFARRDLRGA